MTEMSKEVSGKLAGYLTRYHLNSVKTRAKNLAVGFPMPQNITEFENYQFWQLNAWDDVFRLAHGFALNKIIKRGQQDIRDLADEAREDVNIAKVNLTKATEIQKTVEDALNLLEKLNG